MRIPLKYGLLVTLGSIAWVVISHLLVTNPRSPVHTLGAGVFFNILHIVGIYLAISTYKNEAGDGFSFKGGVKTGAKTALVFAISFCLFMAVAIMVVGAKLMASEPGAETLPLWQVALGAFIGMALGTIIFGVIYSTIISFILAKRQGAT